VKTLMFAAIGVALIATAASAQTGGAQQIQSRDEREQVGAPPEGGRDARRIEGPGAGRTVGMGRHHRHHHMRRHHVLPQDQDR
jgi:hypothetical protein